MNILKKARTEANLTQEKASELLKMPLRTYEDWEAGSVKPYLASLVAEKFRRDGGKRMKIIVHDSLLKKMTLDDMIKIMKSHKAPHGLVVNLTNEDMIIEPDNLESINLFGDYGPGTGYSLFYFESTD